MCESKVFLIRGRKKSKIMDEATLIKDDGKKLTVIGMLGVRKEIEKARIVEVDADRHEVVIKV